MFSNQAVQIQMMQFLKHTLQYLSSSECKNIIPMIPDRSKSIKSLYTVLAHMSKSNDFQILNYTMTAIAGWMSQT